ncbi:MAG: PLP-dependent aminotransferase family protein [Pseudomonadota bacterium]
MVTWTPSLADRPGPKYLRIADALAEDIYAGRLNVGDKVPPHRDLAWRLGVTVGTVSRAYAEAERRGLLVGEVGRGSFVRAGARSAATLDMPSIGGPHTIELAINRPPTAPAVKAFSEALMAQAVNPNLAELMNYQSHTGLWDHRASGAAWLRQRGVDARTETVLVINGVEHGLAAAFMALADPGEAVLVEELTWSGTRALASLMGLRLKPVRMDDEGLDPDAFEAACKSTGARLVYLNPNIHNPTSTVLAEDRRQRIADIAQAHDVTIIEDDVYGFLMPNGPPPLAAYAPDHTVYVTGASKVMAPTLRVGFARMPENRVGRFSAAARAANWMAPPVLAQIVSDWIEDGTAGRLAAAILADVERRQAIARRCLGNAQFRMAPGSFHLWLTLPEPWRAQEFVDAGRGRNLSLAATDLFVPGRAETPHAIRVSVTAPTDLGDLEEGLNRLRDLLSGQPEPCLAVA